MTPCLRWLLAALALAASLEAAEPPGIGSTIFPWESLEAKPTAVGERRDVARNPTATLREFECHISTLNPNLASHPPHTHPQEEIIILRDGELDVHIDGTNTRVGPGAVFFFAANDPHAVQNRGDKPATYFVFNFATAVTATMRGQAPLAADPARLGSSIFHWDKLAVTPTKTGERRSLGQPAHGHDGRFLGSRDDDQRGRGTARAAPTRRRGDRVGEGRTA